MRVALLGGTGQLGRALTAELRRHNDEPVVTARSTVPPMDATDESAIETYLESTRPDAVIYLAAITDLERCEVERELAWRLHVRGPGAAARWCASRGSVLLSVSTDGVFDGVSGNYTELSEANPLNVYAVTKFLGEREVLARGGTVVRTNFLGPGPNSLIASLVHRMEDGEMVIGYTDSVISPLHVADLAETIGTLLRDPVEGLLHIGGQGSIDKQAIAQMVRDTVGHGVVTPGLMPQGLVRRPSNTSLCSDQARALLDVVDRGWEAAVRDCVAQVRAGRP